MKIRDLVPILRPSKQQAARHLRANPTYALSLLLFMTLYCAAAVAGEPLPSNGGVCSPDGRVVTYTHFNMDTNKQTTVTCTCTSDINGGDVSYWDCDES
jgi:hypothetical protein